MAAYQYSPSQFPLPYKRYTIEDELKCGIYFLLKSESVIYVGQSRNIINRVLAHKQSGIDFDTFTYLECDRTHMNHLEAVYTLLLKPLLNLRPDGRPKNPELGTHMEHISFLPAAEATTLVSAGLSQ